jgi:hypothetical protein
MTYLLTILLLGVLFVCVAALYPEGMWSNAVRLINVVTAALLAMNFFEPAARWLEGLWGSLTYVVDFVALWGLFALFAAVLGELTNRISKVKVRFLKVADQIGSGFFALWIGWVMLCFTLVTLHTAPLSRTFLFGGFKAESRMFFGLAPDRQWLGFVRKMSRSTFCRSAVQEFDPQADFMPKYASRRVDLADNIRVRNSILGRSR